MKKEEQVVLVNANNETIDVMEKLEAHKKGLLHRAFSVYLFNQKGELFLQKRSGSKYHSGGLWTNTCCSHPKPNEEIKAAAERRLFEEMGIRISGTDLNEICQFTYKVILDKGMTEHEFLHVLVGYYDGTPQINPEEVEEFTCKAMVDILREIALDPESFTQWFRITIPVIFDRQGRLISSL